MASEHPTAAFVEAIHIAPAAGEPMVARTVVRAIAGVGLEGDRYAVGSGHWSPIHRAGDRLTLVEAEEIEAIERELGIELAPGATRRNITTRGIRLDTLIGGRFRVGQVLGRAVRRCQPCTYLEGLLNQEVLYSLVNRGGIRVEILEDGAISVGDPIVAVD